MVRPMTKEALVNAFSGESMAHTRYLIFADVAEREGFRNVARLFRAIAFAELVHAGNHYSNLRGLSEEAKASAGLPVGPGNTSRNLEIGIMGETFEVNEMYPAYIAIARSQGERGLRGHSRGRWRQRRSTQSSTRRRRSTSTKARTCP